MSLAISLAVCLPLAALLGGLYFLAIRSGKKLKTAFQTTYGPRLKMVSGCGVISGYNRVPGVLGLLDDRVIFQAMITADKGEILFPNIRSWLMEYAGSSRYRRARKYRSARVLALETTDGGTRLFVLSEKTAPAWERQLTILCGPANPNQAAKAR